MTDNSALIDELGELCECADNVEYSPMAAHGSFSRCAYCRARLALETAQRLELQERWRAAKLTNVASNTAWTVYEIATRTHFVPGIIQVHGQAPEQDARNLRGRLSEVGNPLHCHAGRDGECDWPRCPQEADGEPGKTGRSCPLARDEDGNRVFHNSELHNLRSEVERIRGALERIGESALWVRATRGETIAAVREMARAALHETEASTDG